MYVLGIHEDGDYFKVALLKGTRKKNEIIFLKEFKKDILDLNLLKKSVLKEINYKTDKLVVVSALTPEEVFVKTLSFPFSNKRSVIKALPFQMEKVLPFAKEHVTTIPEIKVERKQSTVVLYTFFNETLQSHLQKIKTLGFEPDVVSSISEGLLRFKGFFEGQSEKTTIFYFGWENSYLIYTEKNEVKHSLVIDVGFRMLIDAAREDFPNEENIDFVFLNGKVVKFFKKQLDQKKSGDVFLKLQKALFRAFEYLKKTEGVDRLDILHLGYSAISEEMTAHMTETSLSSLEIAPHLEFDRQDLRAYSIEIGLALDFLQNKKSVLQFRTGEFTPMKEVSKIKRKVKTLLSMSMICSVITAVFLTLLFAKKESVLREKFSYIAKMGGEDPLVYKKIQKGLFSQSDFQDEINAFLKKTKWHKQEGAFLKEPLGVHACLAEIPKEVLVKEFVYELISYPQIEKPKEATLLKIEVLAALESEPALKKVYDTIVKKQKSVLIEKSFEVMKEKNGCQMVFVIKQDD
ncbi:MAG: hypothetical protein FJZ59_04530 [Chlamydiae bacterium]|nr:hypothetical protein [Chlamydiota bacterium]